MKMSVLRVSPIVACLAWGVSGCLLLPESALSALPGRSDGGVSLSQTRVIFRSTDKAQTLALKNSDHRAHLIQSRVQMGPDDTTAAPFVVIPPLFTLPSDNRQLLRIVSLGAALPADRESVFYLSVLAIPAQEEKSTASAQLSMGMRFVIKLFYRPEGLAENAETMACHLRFTPVPEGVRVENPTPYFQTLDQLRFNRISVNLDEYPSMLAPHGTRVYPMPPHSAVEAQWNTLTDYGGLSAPCRQVLATRQEGP
jgi:fimbrial chaperone protein